MKAVLSRNFEDPVGINMIGVALLGRELAPSQGAYSVGYHINANRVFKVCTPTVCLVTTTDNILIRYLIRILLKIM